MYSCTRNSTKVKWYSLKSEMCSLLIFLFSFNDQLLLDLCTKFERKLFSGLNLSKTSVTQFLFIRTSFTWTDSFRTLNFCLTGSVKRRHWNDFEESIFLLISSAASDNWVQSGFGIARFSVILFSDCRWDRGYGEDCRGEGEGMPRRTPPFYIFTSYESFRHVRRPKKMAEYVGRTNLKVSSGKKPISSRHVHIRTTKESRFDADPWRDSNCLTG